MDIVVIGAGDYAKVVVDIVLRASQFNLVGFLDSRLDVGTRVHGYRVLGRQSDMPFLRDTLGVQGVVIAVGHNWLRSNIAREVRTIAPGISFPNALHPSVQIASEVIMGDGNVVTAGAIINSGSTIGSFCLINTGCSLDHDCQLGNFVSIGPGACLGGNVTVDAYSAVCLGVSVINRISIGRHSVVGAGSVVVRDIPAGVVAYGSPARVVRERRPEEPYM